MPIMCAVAGLASITWGAIVLGLGAEMTEPWECAGTIAGGIGAGIGA